MLTGYDPAAATASRASDTWSVVLAAAAGEGQAPVAADGIDADMAAILYTSGSTGQPKGVVLSHRNLIAGAQSVSHYLGNAPEDVILSALPLSFDAGFSQLTTAFSVGAHVVLLNYLLPAGCGAGLRPASASLGSPGVPPLWIQIAEQDWPPEAARHLRYFANTGGRMPKATLERLRSLFPDSLALPHVRADRGIPLHLSLSQPR